MEERNKLTLILRQILQSYQHICILIRTHFTVSWHIHILQHILSWLWTRSKSKHVYRFEYFVVKII